MSDKPKTDPLPLKLTNQQSSLLKDGLRALVEAAVATGADRQNAELDMAFACAHYAYAKGVVEFCDNGLGELLGRLPFDKPLFPNDWGQDVAMVAHVIQDLKKQVAELQGRIDAFVNTATTVTLEPMADSQVTYPTVPVGAVTP